MNAPNQVPSVRETHSLREVAIADHGLGAHLVPQSMADVVRFAETMARGAIAIRKHLRDNPGACLAVTLQALDWGMNPISVANKSYAVNDQLAYEAQLIAAVINARAPIKGRPRYTYIGATGTTRQCRVEVTTKDGEVLDYTSPAVGKITTKNSPLWKSDEDMQLGYFSIRSLARRHFPELLLGVYDREEAASMRDITPRGAQEPSGLAARLAAGKATATEGFTAATAATKALHNPETGEVIEEEAQDATFTEKVEAVASEGAAEFVQGDVSDDNTFPGDRPPTEPEFDALGWATDTNKALDGFKKLADLNVFTDDEVNIAKFEALAKESPGIARSLEAAITGKRKALTSMEQV